MSAIVQNKKLTIYEKSYGYNVYIHGELQNARNYIELLNILDGSPAKGAILIFIDSLGGNSLIGLQISNAILSSINIVSCEIIGSCSSAATLIALSGSELIMKPDTCMYFHNYSKEVHESGAALKKYVEHTDKVMKSMFERIYQPFLTQEEVDHLRNDGEIYICADDPTLEDRMKRHFE